MAKCKPGQVRQAIQEWVPRWHTVAKACTQLTWLDKYPKVLAAMQPADLKAARNKKGITPMDDGEDESNMYVCLDGKVFPLQLFRSSYILQRATYSNKTGDNGVQTLAWSAPCGIPLLVTNLFAAKLSEKRQVELHSPWLKTFPQNVDILADRGFRGTQRSYTK